MQLTWDHVVSSNLSIIQNHLKQFDEYFLDSHFQADSETKKGNVLYAPSHANKSTHSITVFKSKSAAT